MIDKEKQKIYAKMWRVSNPDKRREQQKRYKEKHNEKLKEYDRSYRGDRTKNGYWILKLSNFRRKSKKKGLMFDLLLEDIKDLYSKGCVYCGSDKSVKSIDRKDNNLGYTKANCISSCWLCNKLKSNFMSFNEMIIMGEAIKKNKLNNPTFWTFTPNWKGKGQL